MQENEEVVSSHRAPVLKVFPVMFNLSRCVRRCQATDEAEEVGGSPQGTAAGGGEPGEQEETPQGRPRR